MTRNGIRWSTQSWRRISIAVVVLPLPAIPAISACLVSDRSGTAMSLLVPGALPSRMTCPVNWYAAACAEQAAPHPEPGHGAVDRDREAERAAGVPRVAEHAKHRQLRVRRVLTAPDLRPPGQHREVDDVEVVLGQPPLGDAGRAPHLAGGGPLVLEEAAGLRGGDGVGDGLDDAWRQLPGRGHLDPQRERLLR